MVSPCCGGKAGQMGECVCTWQIPLITQLGVLPKLQAVPAAAAPSAFPAYDCFVSVQMGFNTHGHGPLLYTLQLRSQRINQYVLPCHL